MILVKKTIPTFLSIEGIDIKITMIEPFKMFENIIVKSKFFKKVSIDTLSDNTLVITLF